MNKIRVIIADDHELFRRGLAEIVSEEIDIEVVGQAKDGKEAAHKAVQSSPDVIFMDLNMPGQGGIEATAYLKQHLPQTKVLILTVSEEPADLFRALGVGALGYVLKTASPKEIVEALRQVYQGWVVISPAMAPRFISDLSSPAAARPSPKQTAPPLQPETALTSREEEILQLVAKGMSNAGIATQLIVSENTVKTHIKNILSKLQMKNRSEAAAYAARLGALRGN
jgi:two-component system NarL family response regulator